MAELTDGPSHVWEMVLIPTEWSFTRTVRANWAFVWANQTTNKEMSDGDLLGPINSHHHEEENFNC